jgi:hypothetical protein
MNRIIIIDIMHDLIFNSLLVEVLQIAFCNDIFTLEKYRIFVTKIYIHIYIYIYRLWNEIFCYLALVEAISVLTFTFTFLTHLLSNFWHIYCHKFWHIYCHICDTFTVTFMTHLLSYFWQIYCHISDTCTATFLTHLLSHFWQRVLSYYKQRKIIYTVKFCLNSSIVRVTVGWKCSCSSIKHARKIAKSDCQLLDVYLSFSLSVRNNSAATGRISINLVLDYFSKVCPENSSYIKIWQE